jgi:hypothetical protein
MFVFTRFWIVIAKILLAVHFKSFSFLVCSFALTVYVCSLSVFAIRELLLKGKFSSIELCGLASLDQLLLTLQKLFTYLLNKLS